MAAKLTEIRAPDANDRVSRIRGGGDRRDPRHRLLPGTKLGDEIGEIYGASPTLVRTALQQLAHEGIVNIERTAAPSSRGRRRRCP